MNTVQKLDEMKLLIKTPTRSTYAVSAIIAECSQIIVTEL